MEEKYYRNWHLARNTIELRMTELEFAMMRCQEAFARWIAAADEIVGLRELKHTEHVLLHVIRMQNRPKSGATIARLVNRDDLPNVQYSLRKLESSKLVKKQKEKGSKNYLYSITAVGERLTEEYAKLRAELLFRNVNSLTDFESRADDAAQLLTILTGIYEESARSTVSYDQLDRVGERNSQS